MTCHHDPADGPVGGEVSVHGPAAAAPRTDDLLCGPTASPLHTAPVHELGPGRERSSPAMRRPRPDPENAERDLAELVLTLVEPIRQLMERQALHRAQNGDLSDDQIQELGLALTRLEQAMTRLKDHFDLDDPALGLGALGPFLPED